MVTGSTTMGAKSSSNGTVAAVSEKARGGPDLRFFVGVDPEPVEVVGSFRWSVRWIDARRCSWTEAVVGRERPANAVTGRCGTKAGAAAKVAGVATAHLSVHRGQGYPLACRAPKKIALWLCWNGMTRSRVVTLFKMPTIWMHLYCLYVALRGGALDSCEFGLTRSPAPESSRKGNSGFSRIEAENVRF
jgi:hypothetical protein